MTVVSYANVSPHLNKTKIRRSATHSKDQRRIDSLSVFMNTRSTSVSFDENDYLCSPCYLAVQRETESY